MPETIEIQYRDTLLGRVWFTRHENCEWSCGTLTDLLKWHNEEKN